jgi:hypothetical protein
MLVSYVDVQHLPLEMYGFDLEASIQILLYVFPTEFADFNQQMKILSYLSHSNCNRKKFCKEGYLVTRFRSIARFIDTVVRMKMITRNYNIL